MPGLARAAAAQLAERHEELALGLRRENSELREEARNLSDKVVGRESEAQQLRGAVQSLTAEVESLRAEVQRLRGPAAGGGAQWTAEASQAAEAGWRKRTEAAGQPLSPLVTFQP